MNPYANEHLQNRRKETKLIIKIWVVIQFLGSVSTQNFIRDSMFSVGQYG